MVKVKFDKQKKEWIQLDPKSKDEDAISYDGYLLKKLDNVKKLMSKEWDVVFLIDGIEGSGKSTLSFLCGWYISDASLTMTNIAEGSADAVRKLESLPDKSVLIIDEGSLSFSSKEVMSKEQKQLVRIMNVIRQKRMCLIVVAPSFFELNKYVSVTRSRFLLHVYTNRNLDRGRFSYFGTRKKHKLYYEGKKTFNSYQKPKANFIGTFGKFDPFGEEYQKLKRKSLMEAIRGTADNKEKKPKSEYNIKRDHEIFLAKRMKLLAYSIDEIATLFSVSKRTIFNHLGANTLQNPENEVKIANENTIIL